MSLDFNTKSLRIAIVTERPSYLPGEVVDGIVCLNTHVRLSTLGLLLKVRGVEEVQWRQPYLELRRQYIREPVYEMRNGGYDPFTRQTYPSGRFVAYYKKVEVAPKDVEYYKTCHGQRELVRRDWKLTGAATYEPGQYQFPFLLPLPPDMLPSLSADTMGRVTMSEGKRYRAEVAYKLKVELRMQGKLVPNIKSELPLHISEPPLRGEPHCDTVANLVPASWLQEGVVVTCGCCGHAPAAVQVQLSSDVARAGGALQLTVQNQNASRHPFGRIEVRLMRTAKLVGNQPPTYDLFDHKPDSDTISQKMEGGEYGSRTIQDKAWSKGFSGFSKKDIGATKEFSLELPKELAPSVTDNLFSCYYMLEVHFQCLLASNLVTYIPLKIQGAPGKDASAKTKAKLLTGWRPEQRLPAPAVLRIDSWDSERMLTELCSNEGHFWSNWVLPGTAGQGMAPSDD